MTRQKPSKHSRRKIFVAENYPILRFRICSDLSRMGYDAFGYSSWHTAVWHAHRDMPDLIITNCDEPGMTEAEKPEQLKADQTMGRIKIIGYLTWERQQDTNGFDFVLRYLSVLKPTNLDTLYTKVKEMLEE